MPARAALVCLLLCVVFAGAPPGAPAAGNGGAVFGDAPEPLTAQTFVVPTKVTSGSGPVELRFRLRGSVRKASVSISFVRDGSQRPAQRIRMGRVVVGNLRRVRWRPELPAGTYVARLHATDADGERLRRTRRYSGKVRVRVVAPPAPPATPVVVGRGIFPVRGAYDFGGEEARFGAHRDGHVHQGQDIMAASGTPIVAPVSGTVYWRAYQKRGAGHYLVLRDAGGVDYAFMHLLSGSVEVGEGDAVRAGQVIAAVGSTGRSSAPHLHFEIWPNGWYTTKRSAPVDPLPTLQRWAAG